MNYGFSNLLFVMNFEADNHTFIFINVIQKLVFIQKLN